jgi:hypothetical protein
MSKLQFTQANENGKTVLTLVGQIDESFPPELHNFKPSKELVINLDQVKMINSLGIREWIKFMNANSSTKIEFSMAPKIFIDQVNMVQGFITSNCKITSFYVPYFNEDNNAEKNVLYSLGKEFGEGFLNVAGSVKGEDGSELELDVVEQKYFKFLKN